jgi:hypothetical protein
MKKVITAILVVFCLLAVSCATPAKDDSKRTVSVSGTGTVDLKADTVTFSVSVSETANTTALAQRAANEKVARVLTVIRNFGIPEDCISTANLYFSSSYKWSDGDQVKVGEQVSQTINVKMTDLDNFGKLVDLLGTINGISLNNVNFVASDYSQAAAKARQLAYENARDKALVYSMMGNMELGNPVSINDGYDNYSNARMYVADAKMAAMETSASGTEAPTGLLSVTINVNVVFELVD